MAKNIFKSVFLTSIPLTVCTVVCLLVSNFLILYEYSFITKLAYVNGDNKYYVESGENIAAVRAATAGLDGDFKSITYIIGNGLTATEDFSKYSIRVGRRPASDDEALSGALTIPVNATVHFGGRSYVIVGQTDVEDGEVVISADSLAPDTVIEGLSLRSKIMNRSKADEKIEAHFHSSQITKPEKVNTANLFENNPILILIITMLLLAIFTYAVCFRYLFQKTQKTFTVYLFLGYSADYLICCLISLIFCFVALCFAAGGGAFAIYDAVSASSSATIYPVTLAFTDYLLVFAVFIILSIPMLVPAIRDVFRKSVRYKYV